MTDCYCDYDFRPTFYTRKMRKARKPHRCNECNGAINKGETYQYNWGVWDGEPEEFHTCSRCIELEAWTRAHVPCVCIEHQHLIEDCKEAIEDYQHEVPGLWFGFLRRLYKCVRHDRKEKGR